MPSSNPVEKPLIICIKMLTQLSPPFPWGLHPTHASASPCVPWLNTFSRAPLFPRPIRPVAARLPEGSHAASAHGTTANRPPPPAATPFPCPLVSAFRFPAFRFSPHSPHDLSGSQRHHAHCPGSPGGDSATKVGQCFQPVCPVSSFITLPSSFALGNPSSSYRFGSKLMGLIEVARE